MNSNSSFIVIPSNLENISDVFNWLEKGLFRFIKNKEKRISLSLIIQEGVVNAIIHGNQADKTKKVTVCYEIDNQNLHIKIKDEGSGVPEINQKKDQFNLQDEDLLKDSGRGIILMKHFCKDVVFNKNSIELIYEV